MKKITILFSMLFIVLLGNSQTANDLFYSDEVKVTWLGIDYSNAKLIGDFSQFSEAGGKSSTQMVNTYYPSWNNLVLRERDKYNIQGMLRAGNYATDVEMIMNINRETKVKEVEAYANPNYSKEDIIKIVKNYKVKEKEGIGIVFITEYLNKNLEEACYHFVAFNKENNKILVQKRIIGKPRGIGLRNYWAGSIYDVIKQINQIYYKSWRKEFK